jgi:hypothetical protein
MRSLTVRTCGAVRGRVVRIAPHEVGGAKFIVNCFCEGRLRAASRIFPAHIVRDVPAASG